MYNIFYSLHIWYSAKQICINKLILPRCWTLYQFFLPLRTEKENKKYDMLIYKDTSHVTLTLWKYLLSLDNKNFYACAQQGVTERCHLSWLTDSAHVYEPEFGERGELRGLSQWVQLCTWSPKNFGDITPYLTCGEQLTTSIHVIV
jgi:hypothetical protein